MSKQKYYYAIVDKENGSMVYDNAKFKLPTYNKKEDAKFKKRTNPGSCVTRILITDLEKLILSSKPI